MQKDASRYVPSLADPVYKESLFEIKAVLMKNELNDGRPILYHKADDYGKIFFNLQIDNIWIKILSNHIIQDHQINSPYFKELLSSYF